MQSLKVILGVTGMHILCVCSGCGVCRNGCSMPLVLAEKSLRSAVAGKRGMIIIKRKDVITPGVIPFGDLEAHP